MSTLSKKQTDQAIKTLSTMVTAGKNAVKMLQVARALQSGRKLPAWADEFQWGVTFSNAAAIEKAAKSDSYADFCMLFNLHQKGARLTAGQVELFKRLNKIQLFADTTTMAKIKHSLENPKGEADLPVPAKYNTDQATQAGQTADLEGISTVDRPDILDNILTLSLGLDNDSLHHLLQELGAMLLIREQKQTA